METHSDIFRAVRKAQRIYYSGDISNNSGWFQALPLPYVSGFVELIEEDGDRVIVIAKHQIGDVYRGHCNPRFVTEAAYRAFYAARDTEAEEVEQDAAFNAQLRCAIDTTMRRP